MITEQKSGVDSCRSFAFDTGAGAGAGSEGNAKVFPGANQRFQSDFQNLCSDAYCNDVVFHGHCLL